MTDDVAFVLDAPTERRPRAYVDGSPYYVQRVVAVRTRPRNTEAREPEHMNNLNAKLNEI
jgi:hypothetical protein